MVVQLGGGNDGLNTVIPYFAPQYYDRRPTLAYRHHGSNPNATGWNADALSLDAKLGLGLHPALATLKELHDDGEVPRFQVADTPTPIDRILPPWTFGTPRTAIRREATAGWAGISTRIRSPRGATRRPLPSATTHREP